MVWMISNEGILRQQAVQMPALMEEVPMLEYRNPPTMSGIKPYAIMDLHNLDTSHDLEWTNDIDSSHHAELCVPLLLDNVANISNSNAKLPRVWPYDHSNETSRPTNQPIGTSETASAGSSEMLNFSSPHAFRGQVTKPGPNVVRPIAFKPISANNVSPHSPRHPSGDDHLTSHDLARPQAVKLGTGMLGHRTSPEKVVGRRSQHQMAKPMHHLPHESNNVPPQHGPMGGFRTPNMNNFHHSIPANPQHNAIANSHHHNSSSYSHHSSHHNSSLNNSHNASAASSYSHHNTSATSSRLSCNEDSFIGEFLRPSDRADSVPAARGWHQAGEGILQTPSPSDSGVGELEAILREKDAEINTLREVMDRNERAILQVYEERKNAWALDTQDLREEYERKLKIQSRKSYKTEQVLSLQVYKLQQEQKTLSEEKEKVAEERDTLKTQLEETKTEAAGLHSQLESKSQHEGNESPHSNEELTMKNREVINLHTQLQSYQVDMEKKNKELGEKAKELIGCKEEVDKLKQELERLKNPPVMCESSSQTHAYSEVSNPENVKPSMMGERERTIQTLQDELIELKDQVLGMDDRHEREKVQWLEEKNKVIRYQKQLQLNYVQMQRKNSTLEHEVQQLTLELENRDMKLIALSGEESVC